MHIIRKGNKSLETFGWSFLVVECGFADCELYMSGCRGDDADYLVDLYYNLSSYGKGITGYDMQPYEEKRSYFWSLQNLKRLICHL